MRKTSRKFSKAAKDGACPRCGSKSFTAKRAGGGLLAMGLLAPKTRVRCVTCGWQARRG